MSKENVDLSAEIWTIAEIAAWLRLNEDTVYRRIICLPRFPKGFRPTQAIRGEKRWWAADVKEWAREAA